MHDERFLASLANEEHLDVWFVGRCVGMPDSLPLCDLVRTVPLTSRTPRDAAPDQLDEVIEEFRNILLDIRPDVVHAGPIQDCAYIAVMSDVAPVLATSWGFDMLLDAERGDSWTDATRIVMARSAGYFCDCSTVRDKMVEFGARANRPFVQFPWGTDPQRFSPGPGQPVLRSRFADGRSVVLLCTRSWESLSRVDVVLGAFAKAYATDPNLRLVLLGSGSQHDQVLKKIAHLRLEAVVSTPGQVDVAHLPEYYRAADIYVSSAESDGTSVSLLEAMATGLPVVVTDIPSNREWIDRGANGWLAPSGDVDGFAAAILEAAGLDTQRRREIRDHSRRQVLERAVWSANFDLLVMAYARMVG